MTPVQARWKLSRAWLRHPAVAEAAAIGKPDSHASMLPRYFEARLRSLRGVEKDFQWASGTTVGHWRFLMSASSRLVVKTRPGKIMRRHRLSNSASLLVISACLMSRNRIHSKGPGIRGTSKEPHSVFKEPGLYPKSRIRIQRSRINIRVVAAACPRSSVCRHPRHSRFRDAVRPRPVRAMRGDRWKHDLARSSLVWRREASPDDIAMLQELDARTQNLFHDLQCVRPRVARCLSFPCL